MKYYDITKLNKTNARYKIVFGERSNGKTYQILLHGVKKYLKTGGQMAIIRRWKEDFRGKRAAAYFDNLVCNGKNENKIKELTNGKYETVIYNAGKWYLAIWDSELSKYITAPDPFAYAFALSDMEHDKGNSYPFITTVFYDEFMTRGVYLPDEFVLFMNTISTIIRSRDNVEIFMAANTVSQFCPYFDEMGLTHVRKMKKGGIEIYNYGDSGLVVAVEYSDSPNTFKPSDVYFAFDNPKLKMITGGAWEFDIYPHLPHKFEDKDIQFSYFVVFEEHILQADIVIRDHEAFTFIHKKTTPIKYDFQDVVFSTEADPRHNYLGRLTRPTTKAGKKIYTFFLNNKVFYSTNEIGEIMQHYLNWSNNLLK